MKNRTEERQEKRKFVIFREESVIVFREKKEDMHDRNKIKKYNEIK